MEIIIITLIIIQVVLVLSNLVGFPGGIISAAIPVIFFLTGWIEVKFLIGVLFVIAAGEFAEFYASFVVGKRYGVDSRGFWVSVIAAVLCGIVMAPLFFGIGAVIGTFVGAYAGTLAYELFNGTTPRRAREKAKGMLFGKFLGTFSKVLK
jgi:hypothetical protein